MLDRRQKGFTVLEAVIASTLVVVGMGMAMTGLILMVRGEKRNSVQAELDIDVRTTIQRLQSQLRLTSLDKIVFYRPPGEDHYTAISFPVAADRDSDGLIDMDSNTNIIWDRTLIYHVWRGTPNRLLCTTFQPRDNSLTPQQVLSQLKDVVREGDVSRTIWASNGVTRTVFENLFEWKLWPKGSRFDAYKETLSRELVVFGSILLTPGGHTLSLRVTGQQPGSEGYKIGLDYVRASASGSNREAEWQTVWADPDSVAITRPYMAQGSWSGNYQLLFHATAEGHTLNMVVENDRWEETNFRMAGEGLYRTERVVSDPGTGYQEAFIRLQGLGYNWLAEEQVLLSGGTLGECSDLEYHNTAVRVLLKGSELIDGGFIKWDGQYPYLLFMSPSAFAGGAKKTNIRAVSLARARDDLGLSGAMDLVPGTVRTLTFGTGEIVEGYRWAWPSPIAPYYQIERSNTYAVTFYISALPPGQGGAVAFREDVSTNRIHAYILRNATLADVTNVTWSASTNLETSSRLPCLYGMYTFYPSNGTYTSGIFDTTKANPTYSEIAWNRFIGETAPSGYTDTPGSTAIRFQVRSGNDPYLSDAPPWTNVPFLTTSGEEMAGRAGMGRYVQYRATLVSDVWNTPRLRNVLIRWPGDTRLVDIAAMVTRGPEMGEFELLVDGTNLYRGVRIDLTIYKDVLRGDGQAQRITSAMVAEIEPRNTKR